VTEKTIGYVPGVFDLFHVGHLNILRNSRQRCDWLVAGVVTDEAVERIKGYRPMVPFEERFEIVASSRYVDEAIADHSSDKRLAWSERHFHVLFKGSDWEGSAKAQELESRLAEVNARVVYLPYTEQTSSTMLRDALYRISQSR
jgi:glycerol-3-phosphate cytidylyltransferase